MIDFKAIPGNDSGEASLEMQVEKENTENKGEEEVKEEHKTVEEEEKKE